MHAGRPRVATSAASLHNQSKLAALNAATGWLLPWNPRSEGSWGALTISANAALGTIAVGGELTTIGSLDHPDFAQFRTRFYGCGSRSSTRAHNGAGTAPDGEGRELTATRVRRGLPPVASLAEPA